MDPLDAFQGHLRKIAEAALRFTPKLVSIAPREDGGRTVVYIRTDTLEVGMFVRLIATMAAFCRSEGIPPDYLYSSPTPAPGVPPPGPSPADLPSAWPAEGT